MADDLTRFKLFPRNLTARADVLVRGNPVTTRPESGVENCFPGLEFDQRNMERAFFPGLKFEMHHTSGVILRSFDPAGPAGPFLAQTDIESGVFLAFLQGSFASRKGEVAPRLLRLSAPAGLEAWRWVHDLELGPIAVALCGQAAYERLAGSQDMVPAVEGWLRDRTNRSQSSPFGEFLLLFGERAAYLDADGVIDPVMLAAGELTQSLCSPWQYDFADCGCFYWASNKPDLVASAAQPAQVLNYQRRDRSPQGDLATSGDDWVLRHQHQWDRREAILRHAEMITEWKSLPFVVRRRETDRYMASPAGPSGRILDAPAIVQRLRKLARVEHALAVEYLYAHYSLGTPPRPEETDDVVRNAAQRAAHEVFEVAIDEMRHLRAVNEMLIALGEPPELGRAAVIGEDFDRTGKAFNHAFVLQALTPEHLDWFIAVEAASPNHDGQNTIDGMYSLLLRSVMANVDFSAVQKDMMAAAIRVIIDEGTDHHARFLQARRALSGIKPEVYLKVPGKPKPLPPEDPDFILQAGIDAAYVVVLRALEYAFRLGDDQRGAAVEAARRAMYNMDDAARSLATRGKGAMFDPGDLAAGPAGEGEGPMTIRRIGQPLEDLLPEMQACDPDLAHRMRGRLQKMVSEMERLAPPE